MKKIQILFILLFIGFKLSAQQHLADSVQQLLQQNLPDTARAYNLMMLAMYTEPLDMEKAHKIYKEAVDFSLSKNLDYYAGLALYYESTPFDLAGNYQKQKQNLKDAITFFENSPHFQSKRELARALGGLSNYYLNINQFDSAVVASLKGISILRELEDYGRLVTQCLNLAMIYQRLNLPDQQKKYVDISLTYAKTGKNPGNLLVAYIQQANYYTFIRDFEKAKSYTDSATVYFSENLDFSRKQNYFLVRAGAYQNLGQYDSAVLYFKKASENGKAAGSRWYMTEPLMQIGYIYFKQENYSQAEKYVKEGLDIAEEDSILVFMKEGYGTLSDIYAASGKFKDAYDFLTRYNTIKDSLQSEERKKIAIELEKKYEAEKQANQIQKLEAEKTIQDLSLRKNKIMIQALSGIVLTILVIGFLLIQNYRQKQKLQQEQIKKLEAEKSLAATEAVLKGEEQERSRLAKDLHDGLGGILSGIKFSFQTMKGNLILTPDNARLFERSLDMLDSSIMEMRRVAHNLMPENLIKFGLDAALKDFCGDIQQSGVLQINYISIGLKDTVLDQSTSLSIYRIIQELVNNILKHAQAKKALVQLTKNDKLLLIDVEDDGRGFEQSQMLMSTGIGWTNIKSRLEYLNAKVSLDSTPGKGSSIHIEVQLT